jgi:hypothetical protein
MMFSYSFFMAVGIAADIQVYIPKQCATRFSGAIVFQSPFKASMTAGV